MKTLFNPDSATGRNGGGASTAARLVRTITPEVRVIDKAKGIVDYVASDETLDSYKEVVRARGWRFDLFKKNAPFVDSHNYHTIEKLLGKVTDFRVEGDQLIERVQWAVDVPDNKLAQIGWKMTEAGYLKAVSVGFFPTRTVSKWDNDRTHWLRELKELGMQEETGVRVIYIEQQQIELSVCIIGANPNALAKAYKDGALTEEDMDNFSKEYAKRETATEAAPPAHASLARELERRAFLESIQQ